MLALALAFVVAATWTDARAQSCSRCARELTLDQSQWQCLQARAPTFENQGTAIVVFTLSERACASEAGPTMSGGVIIPGEQRAANAGSVFILSRDQVRCLRLHAAAAEREGQSYYFDFARHCEAATSGARP